MTSSKVHGKSIYNNSELKERLYFFDWPSTSVQYSFLNFSVDRNFFPNRDYKFIEKISDGSASKLYLAKDLIGKNVIIKKIPKNEEWRNELIALKKLKGSRFIINIIDHFESDRMFYIICDYVPGLDMYEHVNVNVPYDLESGSLLLKNMLLCIKECHDNDIAHLDIKCENFMYNKGLVILIDFGHAESVIGSDMMISRGSYGTPCYICPEGYYKYYSKASDIWALGICAHLIFSGCFPFHGTDDDTEYEKNVLKYDLDLEPMQSIASNFIKRCLTYEPTDRPTVDELLNDPLFS
jgi:serine/threonine protein kinase